MHIGLSFLHTHACIQDCIHATIYIVSQPLGDIVVKWYPPDKEGDHYTRVWDAKRQTVEQFWSDCRTKLSDKGYDVENMKLRTSDGSILDDETDFTRV